MNTFWTLIGYVSIALVALSAWSMVRSLGTDRPLTSRSLLLTMAFAVSALVLFDWFIPGSPDAWAWILGVVGLAGGVLVSRATRLSVAGGEVVGRPSPWIVVQWAALFAVAELAAMGVVFDSAGSGVGALFLGTGVAVGSSAMLLRRRQVLARHAAAGATTCPHCHTVLPVGADRCGQCQWQVRVRPRPAAWAPPRAGGG